MPRLCVSGGVTWWRAVIAPPLAVPPTPAKDPTPTLLIRDHHGASGGNLQQPRSPLSQLPRLLPPNHSQMTLQYRSRQQQPSRMKSCTPPLPLLQELAPHSGSPTGRVKTSRDQGSIVVTFNALRRKTLKGLGGVRSWGQRARRRGIKRGRPEALRRLSVRQIKNLLWCLNLAWTTYSWPIRQQKKKGPSPSSGG